MVNVVHQRTLLFFYVLFFAMSIAAVCGNYWLLDERDDNTNLLGGGVNAHYISYLSLWNYCDWKTNCFDVSNLYDGCDFRQNGFQTVRGFLIFGIITITALLITYSVALFTDQQYATRQIACARAVVILQTWAVICFFITFAIWTATVEKQCNGQELRLDNWDYGWCFAFSVAIFIVLLFQLIAIVVTPGTYFKMSGGIWDSIETQAQSTGSGGETSVLITHQAGTTSATEPTAVHVAEMTAVGPTQPTTNAPAATSSTAPVNAPVNAPAAAPAADASATSSAPATHLFTEPSAGATTTTHHTAQPATQTLV